MVRPTSLDPATCSCVFGAACPISEIETRILREGQELRLARRSADVSELIVLCRGWLKTQVERSSHVGANGSMAIVAVHLPSETVYPARGRRGQVRHVAVEPSTVRIATLNVGTPSPLWVRAWRSAAERIERDTTRLASLAIQTPDQRLASFLVDLAHRLGPVPGTASTLRMAMSRAEVAAYLGLTPETVSRAFGRLEASGHVARDGWATVTLPDVARLRSIAGLDE